MHRRTILILAIASCQACKPELAFEIDLTQSEAIPTVFTAAWSVDAETIDAAWWELELEGAPTRTVPVDPTGGPEFETVLIGMKPISTYTGRAWVEIDGEQFASADVELETGQIPAELPDLARSGASSFDGLLVTSIAAMPPTAVILDEDGDYVWWYSAEEIGTLARSHLTHDGRSMLMLDINLQGQARDSLWSVGLDGSGLEQLPSTGAHHDFTELPDGTLALISYSPRDVDGETIQGDKIVELAPDGGTTTVYDIWDDPDIEYHPDDAFMGTMWPHINAIDYLEDSDSYSISILAFDGIAKLDRASGELTEWVGGRFSDYTMDGDTDLYQHQHQHQRSGDSLLVFDNASQEINLSRAVEYELDPASGEATLSWEYPSPQGLSNVVLGDVHRFDSGNTLITWSYGGMIEEVSPAGEQLWALEASVGGALGYTTFLAELPLQ